MAKTSELCAAVWEAPDWLPRFRRQEYPQAFQEYQKRFAPLYAQAVEETEGDLTALEGLANDILDELEAGWKRRRFWNRTAVRVEEKQVIVSYLSPMLLELPDPLCGRLAGMLRQGWADRWPKDAYQITTFEVLQKGFRNSILGIELPDKFLDPTRDR
ncbi:hypothetical protein [Oscillibacter sp.]|uniref:hypothetical protein n=1 Tax=Oscillibacter sp. TaxID=1945593 RepID=UPI001B6692B2|nr:hypothetical protein [Oscillibacter sp.]MBP3509739.1 hypothetical protein [Oscillibacter sp.]